MRILRICGVEAPDVSRHLLSEHVETAVQGIAPDVIEASTGGGVSGSGRSYLFMRRCVDVKQSRPIMILAADRTGLWRVNGLHPHAARVLLISSGAHAWP